MGAIFALGAVVSVGIFSPRWVRENRHGEFLAVWAASVAVLQLFFYWSVVSRYMVFLIMPIILAQAAELEASVEPRVLDRLYGVSFAVVLTLSSALARVDYRYAAAQKEIALMSAERFVGRHVWFSGHWGFQYYMEQAGATQVDALSGGWKALKPGDIVMLPAINSRILPLPGRRSASDTEIFASHDPMPLRLIQQGGAGFFSSKFGFLPYSIDSGPLDVFRVIEWGIGTTSPGSGTSSSG